MAMLRSIIPFTVCDNFNESLGTNWNDYGSHFLIYGNAAINNTLYCYYAPYNGIDLGTGAFTVSANIYSTVTTEYIGLIFNYVDSANYYLVRAKKESGWTQVIGIKAGVSTVFLNNWFTWSDGSLLKVSCDGAGNYSVTVGLTTRTFTDSSPLTGGSAGLYYSGAAAVGDLKWDNFAVTSNSTSIATDDFSRDTSLGANWSDDTSLFKRVNNVAVNNSTPEGSAFAPYVGIDTGTAAFTVQANIYTTQTTEYVGLIFNYIDANNFNRVRVMKNGGWTQVEAFRDGAESTLFINTWSTWSDGSLIKVTGDGAGNYTVLVGQSSHTFTDADPLVGGSVGLYYLSASAVGDIKWDNFSVTYTPGSIQIAGDFNEDGVVNATDIDLLYAAIKAGSTDSVYDVNNDSSVGSADVTYLVETILGTAFGDASLDKIVDVGDLGILAANYGSTSGVGWATGDFTGDGAVDVGDLGVLAANYGSDTSGADFNTDYAKVFGSEKLAETETDDETDLTACSSLGISLIAGLFLAGFMLVKIED